VIGVFAIALLLLLLMLFSSDSGLVPVQKMRTERDRLREEVIRLESEKLELEDQIRRLEAADSFVIEEEARRKGMIREGEEVYRLEYMEIPDSTKKEPAHPRGGE
jgi:cell division protein FtsB